MHVAALLGYRFSILTVLDQLVHVDQAKAAHYGLAGRLASVRAVGIPVLELHDDPARLVDALTGQGLRAVRDDGAHVLILGCTGMQGLAGRVTMALAGRGVTGIPIIDPLAETMRIAAALARGGLAHSKRTYPDPPPKDRPALAVKPVATAGRPG
jgi:allantoin racemase